MIELTGSSLSLAQMNDIIYKEIGVSLNNEALERVNKSRAAVEKIVREDRTVYGINTGFGKFSDVKIDEKDTKALQLHLIRSHSCGVGEAFPETVSRAMVVLRLNALVKRFLRNSCRSVGTICLYGEQSHSSGHSTTRITWCVRRSCAVITSRARFTWRRICLARWNACSSCRLFGKSMACRQLCSKRKKGSRSLTGRKR